MKLTVGEYLEIDDSSGDSVYKCRKCGHVFCSAKDNYKNYTLVKEAPIGNLGNEYSKTERFYFREFYCPVCLTLLCVDMTQKDLPILFDHELRLNGDSKL
jgi:N-methylhydantoinase B